jgi:hypothetical protein
MSARRSLGPGHRRLCGLLLATATLGFVGATSSGCAKPAAQAPKQGEATKRLAGRFDQTVESEQVAGGARALDDALALVDEGSQAGSEGVAAVLAGLDALVFRDTAGLGRVASSHALAFRVPGGIARVEERLTKIAGRSVEQGGSAFARRYVAETLLALARFRGDPAAAEKWRRAAGSLRVMTALGPLDWAAIGTLEKPLPFEAPGAAIPASTKGLGAFATNVAPVALEADDAELDVTSLSTQAGLYALVADLEIAKKQRIFITLRSTSGAVLALGGAPVVTRPYALGSDTIERLAVAEVDKGKIRLTVRVGQNDDGGKIAVHVLDEAGNPVPFSAPVAGDKTDARLLSAGVSPLERTIADAPVLASAALLAVGDGRTARRLLDELGTKDDAAATPSLLFARAALASDDSAEIRRVERARAAYARALAAWPTSWEATIGSALMAAARKGANEGRVESLRELAKLREKGGTDPIVQAFESATAAEVQLRDVAETAFLAARGPLTGTSVLNELDERLHPLVGQEAEDRACTAENRDRQTFACFREKTNRGDNKGALAELGRLRELRGSPHAYPMVELSRRLVEGDDKATLALYDSLLPGQRAMALLGAFAGSDPAATKERLARDQHVARDAPAAILPLQLLLGKDAAVELEKLGAAAVSADRKTPSNGAATLVLRHSETYELDEGGLLHFLIHDVRRASGTADVERVDAGTIVLMYARDVRRTLRRRIYKKDGRVLEPDRAPTASQANADLSQLEPGDYVEHVVEGYALPTRAGHLVVNTPDLLPDRTGVDHATITLRYPKQVALARWSHPLLGKATERDDGDRHEVTLTLDKAQPRRLEEGVPRMNRDVTMSFGTYTWADLGRQLGELLGSLADHDPFVTRWAKGAVGDAKEPRAQLEKLLTTVGKTIRVPSGSMLSDTGAALTSGGQSSTTRAMIELGQGSRTWLLHRALQELSIPHEVLVAETDVFASDESFPAQPGRFDHPLLRVTLPADQGGEVYVDADVDGPPLPVGQITPDLQGRKALRTSGEIVEVKATTDLSSITDHVKVVLKVNEKGDAAGTFEATLRGRPAQALADALERVVGTDRREMLRGVVLGWLPWANVNQVSLSSAEGSWAVTIAAEVELPGYAQREGAGWSLPGLEPLHQVVPRPAAATLGATYTTRLRRDSALAVDTAFQYTFEREVTLPGATPKTVTPLPTATVDDARLHAQRETTLDGHVVKERFQLVLRPGTVATDRYDAFAKAVKTTDDGFLATVRVRLD